MKPSSTRALRTRRPALWPLTLWSLTLALLGTPLRASAANGACEVQSGPTLTPVVELYTSEGCSSCPPADQWLSSLKGQAVVAQAFHVAYWDYIGWKDRFAQPAFTARQKEVAASSQLRGIYTPQVVRNGHDWQLGRPVVDEAHSAKARIALHRVGATDGFEATVEPTDNNANWTAYWTVTENGHSSRVKAGENAGEFLKHDFVVRQYAAAGRYKGAQTLKFFALASQPEHPRIINLVVSDPTSNATLQAVGLPCM